MNRPLTLCHLAVGAALWVALLPGCGGTSVQHPATPGKSAQAVNLAGSWEMDYSQSDNAQQVLDQLVRELQREIERRTPGAMSQGPVGGAMVIGGQGVNSGSSIMGLAQFTEMITQSALLEIEQDDRAIRIRREGDADLTCEFLPGGYRLVETPFATESCGWQAHQLVFRLLLPDGLRIQHVLTAGADGQKLNVATTVATEQVSRTFTLNRVYNRFTPGESGFRCETTLTRGTVCTTKSP